MRLPALAVAALLLPLIATSAAQAAPPVDRAAFVRDFHRDFPAADVSDQQVLAAADATVTQLRAGMTWDQIRPAMPSRLPGVDPSMALSLIQGSLMPGFTPRR